ncbi:hypothetical protein HY932_00350 [Candidatus Falkowbacteria bacterium]|nr:hypothetical protein [Candidatus Falkowbacteria bacterium]
MAQEEYVIDQGPSKLDLMLALFDADMGARTVTFHTPQWVYTHATCELGVKIVSARRRNPAATIWEIEGVVDTPRNNKGESVRVSIYYLSDTRKGRMRFEEQLRTDSMFAPQAAKKAGALMAILHKMIAMYQNEHAGNLHEPIFVLFNRAKGVYLAESDAALDREIQGL